MAQAQALVVLPFLDAKRAEDFAAAVINRGEGSAMPLVLHGTMYEYVSEEEQERGQIIEVWPEARFDVFIGERGENHHILRRTYQEAGS